MNHKSLKLRRDFFLLCRCFFLANWKTFNLTESSGNCPQFQGKNIGEHWQQKHTCNSHNSSFNALKIEPISYSRCTQIHTNKQTAEVNFQLKNKCCTRCCVSPQCWLVSGCVFFACAVQCTHADYCYSRLLPICHNNWKLQMSFTYYLFKCLQHVFNTKHDSIISNLVFSIWLFLSFFQQKNCNFFLQFLILILLGFFFVKFNTAFVSENDIFWDLELLNSYFYIRKSNKRKMNLEP